MSVKGLTTELNVKDLMTKDIICIPPSSTLLDASKLMKEKRISALPIMKGGDLKGIITTTDILNIYSEKEEQGLDPWIPIKEFMISPVQTINENESIKKASEMMKGKKIHHLLVKDDNDKVVGIISSLDITKALQTRIESGNIYRKPEDITALIELTVDSCLSMVPESDLSNEEKKLIENLRSWEVKLQPQFMHLFEAPMDDLDFRDILKQTLQPMIDDTIQLAKSHGKITFREQKIIDTIVAKLNL